MSCTKFLSPRPARVSRKRDTVAKSIGQVNEPRGEEQGRAIRRANGNREGRREQLLPGDRDDRRIQAHQIQPKERTVAASLVSTRAARSIRATLPNGDTAPLLQLRSFGLRKRLARPRLAHTLNCMRPASFLS